jgi:hypothetical protein
MTLRIGLHHFFLEMSKKCWPRFRVRNSTIITGHLILTKNSKSERFVHFFARERQSDSPRKTSTLRCQMQAPRPTFYIDCRKIMHSKSPFFYMARFGNFCRLLGKMRQLEQFLAL